jgi:hypothetical protein
LLLAALHFDPDRFMDERLNKYLIGNPFIFLPFNAGNWRAFRYGHELILSLEARASVSVNNLLIMKHPSSLSD